MMCDGCCVPLFRWRPWPVLAPRARPWDRPPECGRFRRGRRPQGGSPHRRARRTGRTAAKPGRVRSARRALSRAPHRQRSRPVRVPRGRCPAPSLSPRLRARSRVPRVDRIGAPDERCAGVGRQRHALPHALHDAIARMRGPSGDAVDIVMSIVENKKAYHDYFIEEKFEAGVALDGWEVKAIRAGRAQIKEAYVIVKDGEIVLIGAHITPLVSASTHVVADPTRTRKLLLHRREINRLVGQVERAGYTLVPLNLHYSKGRIKLDLGLAKGKKQYDKRATIKEREWNREQQRLLRSRR